jgi:hypothetical protein
VYRTIRKEAFGKLLLFLNINFGITSASTLLFEDLCKENFYFPTWLTPDLKNFLKFLSPSKFPHELQKLNPHELQTSSKYLFS